MKKRVRYRGSKQPGRISSGFLPEQQIDLARALTVVAEGGFPDIAKPLKGIGSGVFELALRFRGDAFRLAYALQIGDDV